MLFSYFCLDSQVNPTSNSSKNSVTLRIVRVSTGFVCGKSK